MVPVEEVLLATPEIQTRKMARRSERHQAKCDVLHGFSDYLRFAISGDMENLRFGLCAVNLISEDARNKEDVGKMVAEIEDRLKIDESVWAKLTAVLDNNIGSARSLCSQLEDGLREEEAERRSLVGGVGERSGQFA